LHNAALGFFPDISQLNHILDLVGTPSETLLSKIESVDVGFPKNRHFFLNFFVSKSAISFAGTELYSKFTAGGPEKLQRRLSSSQR
jgi:hypothetical protein